MCVQYGPRYENPFAVFKVNVSYGTQIGVALPVTVLFPTILRPALAPPNLLSSGCQDTFLYRQAGWQSAQLGHFCLLLGVWVHGAINLLTQTLTTWCSINQKNMIHWIVSKVGTAIRLWEDKAKCPGSILGKDNRFFYFHNHPKISGFHPRPIHCGQGVFLDEGTKKSGREADDKSPPSVEFRNDEGTLFSCTS